MAETAEIPTATETQTADADVDLVTRYFCVTGQVQNVMFRQTVIRAFAKRGLRGGATNDRANHKLVHLTLQGDNDAIDALIGTLASGKALNDWGARAEEVVEVDAAQGMQMEVHQVTTDNVDSKRWNPNCKMYI